MPERPGDGRCTRRSGGKGDLHVALEGGVHGAVSGPAEERLRRVPEVDLDLLGARDGPRQEHLGVAQRLLAGPIEGPLEADARLLARRKALAGEDDAVPGLDVGGRQRGDLHQRGPRGRHPGTGHGEQSREGERDGEESQGPRPVHIGCRTSCRPGGELGANS